MSGGSPLGRAVGALIRPWLRCTVAPGQAGELGLDPQVPIVYALHIRQWSDLVALQEAARALGLPDPLLAPGPRAGATDADGATPAVGVHGAIQVSGARGPFDERSAFFFLTRSGQPSPLTRNPYRYSPRLTRLVAAAAAAPAADLQIVPVSVFWGRAPGKDASVLRALLADGWAVPGFLRQALRVLFNGRHALVRIGRPMRLRELVDGGDPRTALRRVARRLRAQFRAERERAVGPNLSHRDTMVNALLEAPAVRAAIATAAADGSPPPSPAALESRLRRLAVGIVADFSYPYIRVYDRLLGALWNRLYDGVSVHGFERLAQAGDAAGLVYVPCHRSHVDYLLLSYVLYHRGLQVPHVAAGDNLDIPVVGRLLRKGGAFFMRRNFRGDPLYAALFAAYLGTMIRRGFPVEYFVEGGRSRTGFTLTPKTGLLAMTVASVRAEPARALVFVPVYIGYERLVEGRTYLAELGGAPKQRESLGGAVRALRSLRERWGRVHVNVGEPIRLAEWLDPIEPRWRDAQTDLGPAARRLAGEIATRINRAIVVHPIGLLATILLAAPGGAQPADSLARQFDALRRLLVDAPSSAERVVCDETGSQAIAQATASGALERLGPAADAVVRVRERDAPLLLYVRNNLRPAFALAGLVAALLPVGGPIDRGALQRRAAERYPALAAEWFLPWSPEALGPALAAAIDALVAARVLQVAAPLDAGDAGDAGDGSAAAGSLTAACAGDGARLLAVLAAALPQAFAPDVDVGRGEAGG